MPPSARPCPLLAALGLLGLTFLILAFSVAPARAQTGGTTVTLVWTAPGDDGMNGRAARYDLRYSASAISGTDTLSWWNAATAVNMSGKVPPMGGAADSISLTLTSGARYYAILRAGDEVPNWSGFSNVAVIDLVDRIAPARIVDLRLK